MKKKMQFVFATLLIVLFAIQGYSQTAGEIIQKHIEAMGGYENWSQINSMKITGMFTAFSEIKPFVEYKTKDGKFYSRHHKGQFEVIEGCNGANYWVNDPWFELGFPHIANEAEQFVIEQKAEMCTPFFNYQQRGFVVEYEGTEEAEGKNTHKIALTRKDGKKEFWWLDVETYLPVKLVSQWADFAGPARQEVFFDDFRQVKGVVIPFYTERLFSIRHRITEIENIEINPVTEENIFRFPLSAHMEKLAFMEGTWNVVLERRGRNGRLNYADSTVSEIAFSGSMNLMEENISYSAFYTFRLKNSISFSTEIDDYVFTSFNGFNSNMEIYSGSLENDTLNFENVRFLPVGNAAERTTEIAIIKINHDEFVVNYNQNSHDGTPPVTAQRFTYRRID
jgi:hypothetical protein